MYRFILKKKHVLTFFELSKFLIYLIIPMRILDSTCTCILYEENRILWPLKCQTQTKVKLNFEAFKLDTSPCFLCNIYTLYMQYPYFRKYLLCKHEQFSEL